MTEADVFEIGAPMQGEFFKFVNVGDSVKGTYIDVRDGVDSYQNEQRIYVLKTSDGTIKNVAFRKTNTIVLQRMQDATFGMIVGFRLEEIRPSKKAGMNPAKIINPYFSPELVDKEWLEKHEAIKKHIGNSTYSAPSFVAGASTPQTAEAVVPAIPQADKVETGIPLSEEQLASVRAVALGRGIVSEGMTTEEQDKIIADATGLTLTSQNHLQIISALSKPQ